MDVLKAAAAIIQAAALRGPCDRPDTHPDDDSDVDEKEAASQDNPDEEGVKITIRKFGCFQTYRRKGGDRYNPKKGVIFEAPSKMVIKFKPSKSFIDLLNAK